MSRWSWGGILLSMLAGAAACGGPDGGRARAAIPELPGGGRCRVGAGQSSLLVTEWSATEKSNLEAQLSAGPDGGAVAVAFSGCDLRLIPDCRLPGSYVWQRTTPSRDTIEIRDSSELYAKLPLGAVSLSGELERSGTLFIEATVAGHRRLTGATASEVPDTGSCADATHIVNGLALGAFV